MSKPGVSAGMTGERSPLGQIVAKTVELGD